MENLVLLIVCIVLSGFFSGSEIAFFSLSNSKIITLVNKGVSGAKLLQKLKADSDRLLITILVGNNIVNIGASALSTFLATEAFGSSGVAIATGAMTLLILTFGEIAPKSFANTYAVQVATIAAYPIYALQFVLTPFTIVFTVIVGLMNSILGKKGVEPSVTEEEIQALAQLGFAEGTFQEHEQELIENVFALNDLKVKTAMTPKADVTAVSGDATLSDTAKYLTHKHFSRVPVYEGSIDNIIGYLFIKDIIKQPRSKWNQVKIKEIMREPVFVKENVVLISLYDKFVKGQIHFGIVQNHKGEFVGVITLEDIFEEILGDEI